MKVMSLNVGKFSPLGLLEGNKIKEIIACIQMFLFSDPNGVVFLQEVPEDFIDELEKLLNGGAKENFKIIKPKLEPYRKVRGYTIAVKNCKGDWETRVQGGFKNYKKELEEKTSDNEFTDRYTGSGEKKKKRPWFYENKFVEIKSDGLDLQILGVHAPWPGRKKSPPKTSHTVFWEAVKGYAEIKKEENSRFIIIGDMNTDTIEESLYHKYMNCMKDIGYTLAIVEFEKREKRKVVTYSSTTGAKGIEGRLDHAIVSPELKGKVTAQAIPLEILRLSDHAVIIVDVDV